MFLKFITTAAIALAIPAGAIAQTATPPATQTQSTGGDVAVCDAGVSPCAPNTIPGVGADATGADAVAAGPGAAASGTASTAIGPTAQAVGDYAASFGNNAQAAGAWSIASGAGSYAGGVESTADGPGAWASGGVTTAIGYDAMATADYALSVGASSQASGRAATALGPDAAAQTNDSIAVGEAASASGLAGVAVGELATASGDFATALGVEADANGANGVALGDQSNADRGSAVSIGNDGTDGNAMGAFQRQLINLAAGTQAFDAVNLAQLNAGGSSIAAWLGGGAAFDATGSGSFTAPMFVLSNPYTPGSYNSVSGAITALDTAITRVSKQPGPVGPQGPAGATGPQGPAGKDAAGGSGNDPLAVHYDSTSHDDVTLLGIAGTVVHNVADGSAPRDAVNVSQLDEALRSANTYTDLRSIDTLNQANAYTDMRVAGLSARINYALAAASANANAAAAVAAQDPTHRNRVAVSDGLASGVNAWTFVYQHVTDSGVTWNASLTGEQGGGSSSDRQVGVGVGYSW